MLRLLICGDLHLRTESSLYRIGDYYTQQLDKLRYTLKLGEDNRVDSIIFLGDVFHSPNEKYKLIYDVLGILKQTKIKLMGIVGNHDLVGYSGETLKRSPLGILIQSGVLGLLREDLVLPDNVVIRGIDYYSDHKDERYQFKNYEKYLKIICSHNMVCPLDYAKFSFTHPDKVITDTNICFLGHLHQPFDFTSNVMPQKPRFINPGVFFRWPTTEAIINPKVALLTVYYTNEIHTYNVQYLSLNAKPGYEVFNLEKSAETKEDKKTIDNFVKALETTSFDVNNLEESIIKYGECNDVDKSIVNELLSRIKSNRGLYDE